MSEEFLLTSEIMANSRFVSVSLLARYLYVAMILHADQEGRAKAEPLTWKKHGALWGAAEADSATIAHAISELSRAGLIVLYDDNRRLFLPGRFEHNPRREYWRSSKEPLPPLALLERYPEYLKGLRGLTTRGHLRTETTEPRRYPELSPAGDLPPTGGGDAGARGCKEGEEGCNPGNQGANAVGAGADVEVERTPASRSISPQSPEDGPPYGEIIAYLNEKTGKRFRPSTESYRAAIRARWNEGYRVEDFLRVIDLKAEEWAGNSKMQGYLRPQTLFGSKFDSYLNSAPATPAAAGEAYQFFKEDEHEYERR